MSSRFSSIHYGVVLLLCIACGCGKHADGSTTPAGPRSSEGSENGPTPGVTPGATTSPGGARIPPENTTEHIVEDDCSHYTQNKQTHVDRCDDPLGQGFIIRYRPNSTPCSSSSCSNNCDFIGCVQSSGSTLCKAQCTASSIETPVSDR
jgi:hypothetical protein